MKFIYAVSGNQVKNIAHIDNTTQLITQDTFPAREQREGYKAVLAYSEENGGVHWDYIPLTGAEKREEAYRTEKSISYDGMDLTVDEANAYWQKYMAEGSSRADDITALIATAKADIRTRFPDQRKGDAMIIREDLDGFIRHYSDTYKIRKVGTDEIYSEAVDLPDTGFSYIETDIEIEEEEHE